LPTFLVLGKMTHMYIYHKSQKLMKFIP